MVTPELHPLLIRNAQGVAVPFESDWLKATLDRAAREAGYDCWWLVEEFGVAVSQYLREDYDQEAIEVSHLEWVIRATLRDTGYHEIADRFHAVNLFQCVSLADCLGSTGEKQEMVFFKRLAERIEELHAAKVRHFHFYHLQHCAQRLVEDDPVSSWWNDPLMRGRIVGFVRERVQALAWQWSMQ